MYAAHDAPARTAKTSPSRSAREQRHAAAGEGDPGEVEPSVRRRDGDAERAEELDRHHHAERCARDRLVEADRQHRQQQAEQDEQRQLPARTAPERGAREGEQRDRRHRRAHERRARRTDAIEQPRRQRGASLEREHRPDQQRRRGHEVESAPIVHAA
jgi:hypothetical protein